MTTRSPPLPAGQYWMVDDESELVRATVGMLAREVGADHIRGSTDSREVLGWIEQERPAALITDVRMPQLNGLELVTRLHQKWGPVPVIVMTAFPTAQVDQEARAGRFAYLPKPFTFQSLRETLVRICAQPAPSAFSGAIVVTMLGEVVQLYGLANRTGTLRVEGPGVVGDIVFDGGRVVDAGCGNLQGVDAFYEILSWTSGSFSWLPGRPLQVTIQVGLSELLLEAYRRRDERDAGRSSPVTDAVTTSTDEVVDEAFAALENATPSAIQAHADNVRDTLSKLERADGFMGAALFDISARRCMASLETSSTTDVEAQVRGHVEMVLAKQTTIAKLKLDDDLEDIVISLGREYHLVRLCRRRPSCFFFLKLDRTKANVAMARYLLSDVERDIVL